MRQILLYGFLLGVSFVLIRLAHYRLVFLQQTESLYTGIIAALCCGAGIWAGIIMTRKIQKKTEILPLLPEISQPLVLPDMNTMARLHISSREYEVLILIAEGHSNQQIANQLFLSLNTIKTHVSNIFAKLEVERRTQAIQKAKEIGLLS